jgi:HK97 gp10 family phage protein
MAKGFTITVVYNRIPELIAYVEAHSRSVPKQVADKILIAAKSNAPVVTGQLRNSGATNSIEAGKTAEILFAAPYAAYVEYGTYKMGGQFYLSRAMDQYREEFLLEMGEGLFAGF